jgi:hypothetical protein
MESMSTGKRTGHEALIGRSKHGPQGPSVGRSGREGSAGSAWLLALVVVMIVAGAATWKGLGGVEGGGEQDLAPRATAETVDRAPLLEAAEETEGPRVISGVEAGPAGAYASMDRVYDGTGTIFGEVQVEAGVPFPETWTLTLEPSRVAEGRDKAVTRTIQSEPGQRDFQLRDLPMASYRLSVTAEGLVARPQEVALFKLAGYEHMPGVNVIHVTSRLVRVASVEGRVRQASGDMAVDFPVYLIDRKNPNEGRMEAVTDSAGGFKFPDVSSGNWILRTGHPVHSATSPQPVLVHLQPVALDEILLPPLSSLEVETTDAYGRPFPDVELVGYLRGSGNGSFRAKTDAYGRATMRYLTPGPWRVNATDKLEGLRCRLDVALLPGESKMSAMNMR